MRPHAAGLSLVNVGSPKEVLIENGVGGPGLGWKYGCGKCSDAINPVDKRESYRLRLYETHVVVLSIY